MPDLIRWRYYIRAAQTSLDYANAAKARGDKRGRRVWLEQAAGELEMAHFWRSSDAPSVTPQAFMVQA